jgi:2,3-bisphosphoglycerate-independent phosphoglycerate mutase
MKYCVVIMDGAAGLPVPGRGGTSLEIARTPNLDAMARAGVVGTARTVPEGMEPSSACACMSVLGYDPTVYYRGRAGIEARSMGVPVAAGEVVFRCNLVALEDGRMLDYSAGHISNDEAGQLVAALNEALGNDKVRFFPGVSYRHILRLAGQEPTLAATCTPPHDIPGQPVAGFLPHGPGSDVLRGLMKQSETVLRDHPVNSARRARGDLPATTAWLFWGTGAMPDMPPFRQLYGLRAAMTSGVDLLRGLAQMMGMTVLHVPGATDGPDNDYSGQVEAALAALRGHDLAVVHVEAPDEAGHGGSIDEKIEAIQRIDGEIVGRLLTWRGDDLRVLVMPDHPTPISTRTHNPEPVPFMLWGPGLAANGASRFTEPESRQTGLIIDPGCNIINTLIHGQ